MIKFFGVTILISLMVFFESSGIVLALSAEELNQQMAEEANEALQESKTQRIIKEVKRSRDSATGALYWELTKGLREKAGVDKKTKGALIVMVAPESPAEDAGLLPGDVITHINNKRIKNNHKADDYLDDVDPGVSLNITFIRHGEKKNTSVITIPQEQLRNDITDYYRNFGYEFEHLYRGYSEADMYYNQSKENVMKDLLLDLLKTTKAKAQADEEIFMVEVISDIEDDLTSHF